MDRTLSRRGATTAECIASAQAPATCPRADQSCSGPVSDAQLTREANAMARIRRLFPMLVALDEAQREANGTARTAIRGEVMRSAGAVLMQFVTMAELRDALCDALTECSDKSMSRLKSAAVALEPLYQRPANRHAHARLREIQAVLRFATLGGDVMYGTWLEHPELGLSEWLQWGITHPIRPIREDFEEHVTARERFAFELAGLLEYTPENAFELFEQVDAELARRIEARRRFDNGEDVPEEELEERMV